MAKNFKYHQYRGEKLDAEQTEKVLTAHELGMLEAGGRSWYPQLLDDTFVCNGVKGCINQIVHNIPLGGKAWDANPAVACWFDQNYDQYWTVEDFLKAMRSAKVTSA